MKCATSSLHHYLDLHPEVAMSRRKELNFFLSEAPLPPLLTERSSRLRGLEWYRSNFDPTASVRGESSVAYSFPWQHGVAERIAAEVEAPRFIYCVRDPIERALSHHRQFAQRDRRPPATALAEPANPYLQASRYATAVAPFLRRFGRERVLIVDQAALRERRNETIESIYNFIGVNPGFRSPDFEQQRNVSAGKGARFRVAEGLRSSGPTAALAARIGPRARQAVERRLRSATEPAAAPRLPPELQTQLLVELEDEITAIEVLTGWDLRRWRQPGER